MSKLKRQAYASLRLTGDDLDPSDVTNRLLLPPDMSFRQGDIRVTRTLRGKVRVEGACRHGLWSMSSKEWVHGSNLGAHLTWLLDQVQPKLVELKKIMSSGARGTLFCLWRAAEEPNVPKAVRQRAANFGLEIEVDHQPIVLGVDPQG